MRRLLLPGATAIILSLVLLIPTDSIRSSENDSDKDVISDAYCLFYGLELTNSADVNLDYDGDNLNNRQEFKLLTDPLAPDTDRDGFNDDVDEVPISRAYIQWGNPQFTSGDQYDYAHPDWFLAAYKDCGDWIVLSKEPSNYGPHMEYKSLWYVPSEESNDVGNLNIDLDRTILTNNLRYAVHYFDSVNSSLYVDLLDTNGEAVAKDLFGNIMTGSNVESAVILDIPTATYPDAAVVQLRRGDGEIAVFEALVYIDEDGDGWDADQERQMGTSDYKFNSDGRGTNIFSQYTNNNSTSTNNTDNGDNNNNNDNDNNLKKKGIIYVDQANGDDSLSGYSSDVDGKHGPKKTVHGGLSVAEPDNTIIIKSGNYNEDLNIQGRDIHVVIDGNVKL